LYLEYELGRGSLYLECLVDLRDISVSECDIDDDTDDLGDDT
jgi:hypothetical protein